MFDVARAALLAAGHTGADNIKTHNGLIAEFGRRVVLTGLVDADLGRAFNRLQNIRLLADYSAEEPPVEDTAWAVAQAEVFVSVIARQFGQARDSDQIDRQSGQPRSNT